MAKRNISILGILVLLIAGVVFRAAAQQDSTRLRVVVNLVQLNVAVTDSKGNYVTDLRPSDFVVTEDGIAETIATFEEGNGPAKRLVELTAEGKAPSGEPAGHSPVRNSSAGSSTEDPQEPMSA